MSKNYTKSLSTKIVLSIALVLFVCVAVIFFVLEGINKRAFYAIEQEKVELIAETIEPLIAMSIYLGFDDRTEQMISRLLLNPNILKVQILQDGRVVFESERSSDVDGSIVAMRDIVQPNSLARLGSIKIFYSNQHYTKLMEKQTRSYLYFLFLMSIVFALFSLYIKHLLEPLRSIATKLYGYTPNSKIDIPFSSQKNEIGLISKALISMQSKIFEYSKKQQNINLQLEQKVDEKTSELRRQFLTDPLTKLPNRAATSSALSLAESGAFLIINIDDFKEINDYFGHIVGDDILIKFANRLDSLVHEREVALLSRLSGDEFAILFRESLSYISFQVTINRLLEQINSMIFYQDENELRIRVSVGATISVDSALEKADIALKYARGNNTPYAIYSEEFNVEKRYKENMEWVKRLRYSIDNNKIVPYYQPIFDNNSAKILSYECLMRMIDRDGSVLTPLQFLDIAKKSRLYTELTRIMIEKSCIHFKDSDCKFSINLSIEDMLDHDTVVFLKDRVLYYGVADKIIFEILESESIETYADVSNFIIEMRELGCEFAIDDFGSGYSNYEHLLRLDIDYIKIDGALIKNLDTDKNAQIVVGTIVEFARHMDIAIVAEYVHNQEIHEKVKKLNISRSQGYHLGKPGASTNRG